MGKQLTFDVLETTATQLKHKLNSGKLTSRTIVETYLEQIERHNRNGLQLRALIEIAPRTLLLSTADKLDKERKEGKLRGEFHGIPIVIKDTINTLRDELGLSTTNGTHALDNTRPSKNAKVVEMLIEQGIIILGKANLSEYGTSKSHKCDPGFSPTGGQTRSAYVDWDHNPHKDLYGDHNPGGSSSGSAVAVAAGFVPWSLGADTDGSVNNPAGRSSLYALKPTIGRVSGEGVFKLSDAFDSVGGMAKSPEDLAHLTQLLHSTAELGRQHQLPNELKDSFKGISVGFVDPDKWVQPEHYTNDENYLRQRREDFKRVMKQITDNGGRVVENVEIKTPDEHTFKGKPIYPIVRNGGWKILVDRYLKDLAESEVRSLQDIVQWNKDHPDLEFYPECPDQEILIQDLENPTDPHTVEQAVRTGRVSAGDDIDAAFEKHKIDCLMIPTDSKISTVASLAGYPIGTMPLGYLQPSGRPHGISVLTRTDEAHLILNVMSAYEATGFKRKVPALVANYPEESEKDAKKEQANGHR